MIDSHCHLDFKEFDGQRERAVRDAADVGVHTIINIGTDLESSLTSVQLAERFDSVYATVGVHPHDARKLDDATLDELRRAAEHQKVVAVGEIGLDFYRDLSPRPVQVDAFHRQLELAVEVKLPVVIHTRQALSETLDIVRQYTGQLAGGVFHCFPGSAAEAYAVFDLGFVISVGGVVTYKDSGMSRVAAEVPLERLLLETDAPFLTPVPHRGRTNCPAYVRYVRDKVAELRGENRAEVEKITDRTCQKLFGLVETFGG